MPPTSLRRTGRSDAEIERVLDRAGAALLRHPEQDQQQLAGRLGIGQRAMHGSRRQREPVGERVQIAAQPAAGEQPPCERDRVEHRQLEPAPVDRAERALQEAHVEARVVRDEDAALGEPEQIAQRRPDGPCAREIALPDAGERRDQRRYRHARIDEALEARDDLEALDAHGADLDDARAPPHARGLEVDDAEARLLERRLGRRRPVGERDVAVTHQAEPGIRADHLVQQAGHEPRRRAAQGEQPACRFLRGERAPMRVQRIHEPVSATERELKLSVHEHMFAYSPARRGTCPTVEHRRRRRARMGEPSAPEPATSP